MNDKRVFLEYLTSRQLIVRESLSKYRFLATKRGFYSDKIVESLIYVFVIAKQMNPSYPDQYIVHFDLLYLALSSSTLSLSENIPIGNDDLIVTFLT